jgi:TolB-like protein/tetratricopeptide (TPR) repeat protein
MEGESPKPPSAPTGAVFLSYASQDTDVAQRICTALRGAGIEVWFDQSELRGGDAWDRQIRQRIHDCRLFIAVISAHTETRDEGYFRREWRLAVERAGDMAEGKAFLIPVVIDDTRERSAAVPDKFHEVHWTRLPSGHATPSFIDRISGILSPQHAASNRHSTDLAGDSAATHRPIAARRSLPVPVLIVVGLAVAAAGLLAYKLSTRGAQNASPVAAHAAPSGGTTGSPASGAVPQSIVVLPFTDMSEKHDQEYFGDGMAEEVIDRLAQLPQLRVISRTSAFQFKGKNEDVRTIAARLAVTHVLEGSVRRSADRLRVSVQLIKATDGSQRWSQSYDRNTSHIFQVQDEIAGEVVKALRLRLSAPLEREQATTDNLAAHNLLLQGRFFQNRSAPGDSERAIAAYEQALKEDPGYALAWAELAWTEMWVRPADVQRASNAAQRAIELRPDLAQAHATRGWYEQLFGLDWEAADRELDKALALEPQNMLGLYGKGRLARVMRRTDESLHYYHAALERDPVNAFAIQGLSTTLIALGRSAEAVGAARKALDISPGIDAGHSYLANALLWNGELETARREIELEPIDSERLSTIALIEGAGDNQVAADAALRELLSAADTDKVCNIAAVYAFRRDVSAAISWLERARKAHCAGFAEITTDPAFGAVRSVPAFMAYLHDLKLPN